MILKHIFQRFFKSFRKVDLVDIGNSGMESWEIAAAILDNRICETCRFYFFDCDRKDEITCKKWIERNFEVEIKKFQRLGLTAAEAAELIRKNYGLRK